MNLKNIRIKFFLLSFLAFNMHSPLQGAWYDPAVNAWNNVRSWFAGWFTSGSQAAKLAATKAFRSSPEKNLNALTSFLSDFESFISDVKNFNEGSETWSNLINNHQKIMTELDTSSISGIPNSIENSLTNLKDEEVERSLKNAFMALKSDLLWKDLIDQNMVKTLKVSPITSQRIIAYLQQHTSVDNSQYLRWLQLQKSDPIPLVPNTAKDLNYYATVLRNFKAYTTLERLFNSKAGFLKDIKTPYRKLAITSPDLKTIDNLKKPS